MKKYIPKICAFFLSIPLFLGNSLVIAQTANAPMKVKTVPDTIAGYATVLESSQGTPNADVVFRVEKPDGGVVEILATTNAAGIASTDFLGFHTRKAGGYTASVYYHPYTYEQQAPALTRFQVYPDSVSPTTSGLSFQNSSVRSDGVDTSLLTVRLADQYSNPVSGHRVTVISSRPSDTIHEAFVNQGTDQYGQKVFEVSCSEPGVSYFTALDQQNGAVISSRAELICFEPVENPATNSGSSFLANLFGGGDNTASAGPASRFKLEFAGPGNQANVAVVGNDQNYFTITAVDANGNTVTNYTGSVLISVPNDSAAKLPSNGQYTFRSADQGSVKFSLAFQFSQTGTQTIEVYGYDPNTGEISRTLSGKLDITVGQSSDVPVDPGNAGAGSITLKNPADGSKYAATAVPVAGTGPTNSDLRILLDGAEVASVVTDGTGLFFTTLPSVAEGGHTLYVQNKAGDRGFSSTVSFTIDSKAPTLDQVSKYPETALSVGSAITITVVSEPKLKKATVRINGQEYPLTEKAAAPGNYERALPVPTLPGEYTADVVLEDELGNTSTFLSQVRFVVTDTPVASNTTPPTLSGLTAQAAAESVRLSWQPVSDYAEKIALYVIYQGNSEFNLREIGSVPATEQSFLVKNLEAGQEYLFTVTAVDIQGKEGLKANAVSARPLFPDGTQPVQPSQNEKVRALAGDGSVTLAWQVSTEPTDRYLIEYGISPNQYAESMILSRLQQSVTITDLINGIPYYFRVTAYQGSTPNGESYPIVAATPLSGGLHGAAQPLLDLGNVPQNASSGPEAALLFIGISFLCTAGFFLLRRPRFH